MTDTNRYKPNCNKSLGSNPSEDNDSPSRRQIALKDLIKLRFDTSKLKSFCIDRSINMQLVSLHS